MPNKQFLLPIHVNSNRKINLTIKQMCAIIIGHDMTGTTKRRETGYIS